MATRCKDWMIELWNEAPWYFWVYITMAGLQIFFDDIVYGFFIIFSVITFTFLMKRHGLLRNYYVYIIVCPAVFFAHILISSLLGENLHLFFTHTLTRVHYYYIYTVLIQALVSALLAFPFVALYEKNFARTVIISTCLFCMIISCYVPIMYGTVMILLGIFDTH